MLAHPHYALLATTTLAAVALLMPGQFLATAASLAVGRAALVAMDP